MILARGAELTAADLEFSRRPGSPPPPAAATTPAAGARPGVPGRDGTRPLHERLSDQERAEIIAAIDQAQGNIALAARTLGINRSTLYYRLRKHGLEHLLPMKESPTGGEAGGAAGPVATPSSGTGNSPQS
jgi:transcriptional regulator of acetoin/glycerol metabolism